VSGEPILVVDDNPQNLKLVRVLLSREGYQVATAADGQEALAVLDTFRPRLILMDLQMPGLDGLSLTRQLKASPVNGHIIIVALTAYAMKGDREKALAAGCDDYVSKPIDADNLCQTIERHLGGGTEPPP
jgi:two-component system cell cycle response regulator DivK